MKKLTTTTIRTISMILVGAMLLSSCASTTMIQSVPSGAKLYLNGEPVGTTPYTYTDTKITGTRTTVKLVKEGYQPLDAAFSRDEEVDGGAVVAGIFFIVPFVGTMRYKPTHTYELKPLSTEPDPTLITVPRPKSKAERLRELKQLLDEKIITQEEFDKEKKKILEEDEK